MNVNWFLAILVEKKILEKDVASELAKVLDTTTYSSSFNEAHSDIKKILKDIKESL